MLPCSVQASWRTQIFPTMDLSFEITVSTLATPEQLNLLEFQPEGGIATLPVPSNPQDFLIFIIKQLAFIPLYQWSLQQNFNKQQQWLDKTQSQYQSQCLLQTLIILIKFKLGSWDKTRPNENPTWLFTTTIGFSNPIWFHYSSFQSSLVQPQPLVMALNSDFQTF